MSSSDDPFAMPKRGLRCRLGLHDWWTDCALINSYRACHRCERPDDREAQRRTMKERLRMSALPPGATIGELYVAALDLPHPVRPPRR